MMVDGCANGIVESKDCRTIESHFTANKARLFEIINTLRQLLTFFPPVISPRRSLT